MGKHVTLEELTAENVLGLTEEEVSNLLYKEINELPKEKRSYYVNLINTAFEFRSISAKNRGLKGDLSMFGFRFFTIPNDSKYIMGIRRKVA